MSFAVSTTDPVLEAVREIVADIWSVDIEEVRPSARFCLDFGAESIELLELSWHCEKRFQIKLPIQQLFPAGMLVTDQNGVLTGESLAGLRKELPFLDFDLIADDPRKERLVELFTVEAIAHFVRRALADKEHPEPQPGAEAAQAV